MATNGLTRLIFFFLLVTSLMLHAFVFAVLWIVPTIVASLLNLRTAHAMANANKRDYLFAILFFPAEIYMWIRLGHFARSWAKFASSSQTDNWALQAKAESGSGGPAHLAPAGLALLTLITSVAVWAQFPTSVQSDVLLAGWTVLGIITILQTAMMVLKLMKRYKGYKA